MKRYLLTLHPGWNIDSIVMILESQDERNEVVHVNRFLDYITINSWNPSSLRVPGISDIVEDPDLN